MDLRDPWAIFWPRRISREGPSGRMCSGAVISKSRKFPTGFQQELGGVSCEVAIVSSRTLGQVLNPYGLMVVLPGKEGGLNSLGLVTCTVAVGAKGKSRGNGANKIWDFRLASSSRRGLYRSQCTNRLPGYCPTPSTGKNWSKRSNHRPRFTISRGAICKNGSRGVGCTWYSVLAV